MLDVVRQLKVLRAEEVTLDEAWKEQNQALADSSSTEKLPLDVSPHDQCLSTGQPASNKG